MCVVLGFCERCWRRVPYEYMIVCYRIYMHKKCTYTLIDSLFNISKLHKCG